MKKKVYHITANLVGRDDIKKTETVVAKNKIKAIEIFWLKNSVWNVIDCKEMCVDERNR